MRHPLLDAAPSWLQLVGTVLMGTPVEIEGTFAVVVSVTNGVMPSASSTFLITVPGPTTPPTMAPTITQSHGAVPVITSTPSSSSILVNTVYISPPIQATGSGIVYQVV